jgi:hypothetical protein
MSSVYRNRNFRILAGIITLMLLLLADSVDAVPVEEWSRTFESGEANYVQQTTDGGYAIAGELSGNAWLIKTDTKGRVFLNKTFVTGKAFFVMQNSDGGYDLIGQTQTGTPLIGNCVPYGNESENLTLCWDIWVITCDYWLIKTDKKGNERLYKKFGSKAIEVGDSASFVQQTSDGGYILATTLLPRVTFSDDIYKTKSEDTYESAWLIKIDNNGNEQWNGSFGKNVIVHSVQQTPDGGYMLFFDSWLVKIDNKGNEEWNMTSKKIRQWSGQLLSTQQTADGKYILAGWTRLYNTSDSDALLIKTDANGIEQWNKTFGGKNEDSALAVKQVLDGYVLLCRSYEDGDWKIWIIKTDIDGNEQWNKTIGENILSFQQTTDGGYILAGDASLIKLGYRSAESIAGFECLMAIFSIIILFVKSRKEKQSIDAENGTN